MFSATVTFNKIYIEWCKDNEAVLNAAAVAVAYVKKTINAFSDQWLLFHFWRGYVSATSAAATTSLLLTQSAITAGQSTLMYYSLCSSSSIRA